LEAEADGAATAAGDAIAAPAGVDEGDVEAGEAGADEGFDEGGVEALVGDAIAVEDYPVAGLQVEGALREGGAGDEEEEQGSEHGIVRISPILYRGGEASGDRVHNRGMAVELIAPLKSRDLGAVRAIVARDGEAARHASVIVQAAGLGWPEATALLLEQGADANAEWRNYRPLHALMQEEPHAAAGQPAAERVETLRLLLRRGADPELRGAWPATRALLIAGFVGLPVYTEILLEAGAAVDGFAAAALGDVALFRRIFKKDPGLATAREGGVLTALMCACGTRLNAKGGAAIAELLLDNGADANAQAKSWGRFVDVAHFAATAKNKAAFRLLLERGANPHEALVPAIWNGGLDYAQLALDHGANPDVPRPEKRPLLNNLITWGQMGPTLWLLERGANPNLADARGYTALHQAASRGNVRMLEALLAHGADPTLKDANGDTAYEVAEAKGKAKVIALLAAREKGRGR